MLLLLLKQCLQEQVRHVYGTILWLPSRQMSKLCGDTRPAAHQDLPRVSRERGGSDPGDTWVGELPSRPQTHWNFPWEDDSEETKPKETLFYSWLQAGIPSPPSSGGLCSAESQISRCRLGTGSCSHRPACAPALDTPASHLRSPGVQETRKCQSCDYTWSPPSLTCCEAPGSSASALAVGVHQISFAAPVPILA